MGVIEGKVLAATTITYPISELGNCDSKDACKRYCDHAGNIAACVNFGRAHGIYTSSEASGDRAPGGQPGGDLMGLTFPISELGNCESVQTCKAYCDQPANRQACFDFAYKYGLQKGKKAAEKLSGLKFPIAELGNCGNMSECETYCSQSDHFQACNEYAKSHGFEAPKNIGGPGGCRSAEECNAYCSNPDHRQECDEAWQKYCAPHPDWPECQKGPGHGPGGCSSDEECERYCREHPDDQECRRGREEWCQQHPDECKEHTGPGGCMSEEECRLYCEQHPDDAECRRGHKEWCQQHPDECREDGEQGPCSGEEECRRYCQENPDSDYCRQKSEEYCQQRPDECRDRDHEEEKPGGGPGGCQSEEECDRYCQEHPDDEDCRRANEEWCQQHPDECQRQQEEQPEEQTGPGRCRTPEECEAYCRDHPNECGGGPSPDQSGSPPGE